jgi:hypothetical protein
MGTGSHLGIEKFNLAARIKAVHVPARPGEGIADTIANSVAGKPVLHPKCRAVFADASAATAQIKQPEPRQVARCCLDVDSL